MHKPPCLTLLAGQWQGATVAVKYILSQHDSAQEAAANEAVLGRLLAHPNVVQTFSCKVALLDELFFKVGNISERKATHTPLVLACVPAHIRACTCTCTSLCRAHACARTHTPASPYVISACI